MDNNSSDAWRSGIFMLNGPVDTSRHCSACASPAATLPTTRLLCKGNVLTSRSQVLEIWYLWRQVVPRTGQAGIGRSKSNMKRALVPMVITVIRIFALTPAAAAAQPPAMPVAPTEKVVRARADALIAQMTPQEKAGQLSQFFYFTIFPPMNAGTDAAIEAGGAGALLFVTDPTSINRLQHIAVD